MRFTIISHACLLIEHGDKKLLVDPWLSGSCYWRSWWHFPPAHNIDGILEEIDFIYLTHEHFDHFHYPSMRRFPKDIPIYVADFPTKGMVSGLESLGFKHIYPLAHGETTNLAADLQLTSYQSRWLDDSALVVEGGETTLFDLNDGKFPDGVLRKLAQKHGGIDFMFKSHSSAQAYPHRYSSSDPKDLSYRPKESYVQEFLHTAQALETAYAIPFASNVCFLHPETFDQNAHIMNPASIENFYDESVHQFNLEVMLPGDSWSEEEGFHIQATDVFAQQETLLSAMREEVASKVAAQSEYEKNKALDFDTFKNYFEDFLKSLPMPLSFLFRVKTAYAIPGEQESWWVLDFSKRCVTQHDEKPTDVVSISSVEPGLLQDAIEKTIVNFLEISMRVRIEISPGKVFQHFIARELLAMYEQGNFPLEKNMQVHFVRAWLRRRDELLAYGVQVLKKGKKGFLPGKARSS